MAPAPPRPGGAGIGRRLHRDRVPLADGGRRPRRRSRQHLGPAGPAPGPGRPCGRVRRAVPARRLGGLRAAGREGRRLLPGLQHASRAAPAAPGDPGLPGRPVVLDARRLCRRPPGRPGGPGGLGDGAPREPGRGAHADGADRVRARGRLRSRQHRPAEGRGRPGQLAGSADPDGARARLPGGPGVRPDGRRPVLRLHLHDPPGPRVLRQRHHHLAGLPLGPEAQRRRPGTHRAAADGHHADDRGQRQQVAGAGARPALRGAVPPGRAGHISGRGHLRRRRGPPPPPGLHPGAGAGAGGGDGRRVGAEGAQAAGQLGDLEHRELFEGLLHHRGRGAPRGRGRRLLRAPAEESPGGHAGQRQLRAQPAGGDRPPRGAVPLPVLHRPGRPRRPAQPAAHRDRGSATATAPGSPTPTAPPRPGRPPTAWSPT